MIKNSLMNRFFAIFVLGLFSILSFSVFASAELSLGINAHLVDGADDYSATFRAVTDTDSSVGYDGFDLIVPSNPSTPYAEFYSDVSGNKLAVDSWPSSANPRTLNLTFKDFPSAAGDLYLTWNYPGASYNVTLNDYGSDSSRTSLIQSVNLNTQPYTKLFVSTGSHYFSLTVDNVVVVFNGSNGSSSGGGSGGAGAAGGGSGSVCDESKLCTEWSECQNLEESLKSGAVVFDDYSIFKADCATSKFNEKTCGYQIRECNIISACANVSNPSQSQFCQYVKNPSCNDKVKNCHNGKCEVLVDCGGPCGACASCNNGIKDKGEQGIDCGGSCAAQCPTTTLSEVLANPNTKLYSYLGVLVILLGILIAFVVRLIKIVNQRKNDSLKWYNI